MVVNIWDVCARSKEPLTIEEIAHQLQARGLEMNADALIFYKNRELAKLDPVIAKQFENAWTNESPPAEVIDKAWHEYVAHVVQTGPASRHLSASTDDDRRPHDRSAVRRYSANRQKPPLVYRYLVTTERKLVPYDPEQREQANEAHTAGMEFLRRKAELGNRSPKATEVRELLDLAETAIRAKA